MRFDERHSILVTCFPGLAPFLQREVEALGMEIVSSHDTGVMTFGDLRAAMRLNLTLRTALNVLYLVKEFESGTADELYSRVTAMPWEDIIPPEERLCVLAEVDTPAIDNTMYAAVRTKDAIVDRIRRCAGRRPNSGPERTGAVVNLFWKDRRAWLYLNTSGEKISDRGYRLLPHKAPLRETLAAAIVLATGYDGTRPLLLPMCGSGTLAIEAALIALDQAPAFLRQNFGFMHLKGYEPNFWRALREKAAASVRSDIEAPIIASDHDPQAVRAARRNAAAASVERFIRFHTCDFAETPLPDGAGILIVNPEYGERLGERDALKATYRRIGDFMKQKCAGWTGYVFTGNLDLAEHIGLRPSRRLRMFNGRIECRLLEYPLYRGRRRGKRRPE